MSEILVNVTRGNAIESIHRGHIVVVNSKGDILYQLGNPDFNICLRSCAKPLQTLPIITTGTADTFSFTPAELAVMSGSLNGQDFVLFCFKTPNFEAVSQFKKWQIIVNFRRGPTTKI